MRKETNSWREACIVAIALLALLIASISTQAQRKLFGPGRYEGENLVNSGKAQVNGGSVAAQPMSGFGTGWSGNAQLFWGGGSPGAVLDLTLDVAEEGIYEIELYMTRAPDFGRLRIQVENKNVGERFDGYASSVTPSGPISLGTFALDRGARKISFIIDGKNERSTNYFAGIDFISLKKMKTAAAKTQSGLGTPPQWKITAFSVSPEPTEKGIGGEKAYKEYQVITVNCSYEPIVAGKVRLRIVEGMTSFPVSYWIKQDLTVTKGGSQTMSFPVAYPGAHYVNCGVVPFEGDEWIDPGEVNIGYQDEQAFKFQVVGGKVPQQTKWPDAPFIETPIKNGKIVIKPRDPSPTSGHCVDGGFFSVQLQYQAEPGNWKPVEQPARTMKMPLACVPEGSTKDISWLKPGIYRVKAQQRNTKYKFTSEWSDWIYF